MISKYYVFDNYILTVAVISWMSAQVIKTLLNFLLKGKFSLERLFGAGGMPSSHSALVCSMTVGMAKQTGPSTPEFALAFLFMSVVMYDAMGVRRAAGEHARIINKFFSNKRHALELKNASPEQENESGNNKRKSKKRLSDDYKKLKEYLGHTPLEVMCGALLGTLVAMMLPAM